MVEVKIFLAPSIPSELWMNLRFEWISLPRQNSTVDVDIWNIYGTKEWNNSGFRRVPLRLSFFEFLKWLKFMSTFRRVQSWDQNCSTCDQIECQWQCIFLYGATNLPNVQFVKLNFDPCSNAGTVFKLIYVFPVTLLEYKCNKRFVDYTCKEIGPEYTVFKDYVRYFFLVFRILI
jgi:hypothetical protein